MDKLGKSLGLHPRDREFESHSGLQFFKYFYVEGSLGLSSFHRFLLGTGVARCESFGARWHLLITNIQEK